MTQSESSSAVDYQAVTEADRDAAAAPVGTPASKWAIHRRLYDWVLSFAHKPYGTWALGVLSFMESSFFPIPPDVLLGPMCLGARRKSMWFATVTTVASVLGAYLGYVIGMAFINVALMIPGIEMGVLQPDGTYPKATINWLAAEFDQRGIIYVFIAALTPIPFKLLTVTSGFAKMDLVPFTLACIIGRGLRFYGVAGLFWWVGPKAMPFIDKYFNLLCVIFTILLIGGVFALKYLR